MFILRLQVIIEYGKVEVDEFIARADAIEVAFREVILILANISAHTSNSRQALKQLQVSQTIML
jgi:hypothetical protein